MPTASAEVAAAVADAHRREWAFVLAATRRVADDLDTAEEAVQDAYAAALTVWNERGIPRNPAAWLTTSARRRVLDLRRRADVARRALPDLLPAQETEPDPDAQAFPDDRLRLVFTCCHPALSQEAQVALTLRLICGLSVAEIARAFLVSDTTMAARITRAKKKIAAARIPYRLPEPADLQGRLDSVLAVIHVVYTTGHTAPAGAELMRRGLSERAIDLAVMLRFLLPDDPDVAGLLGLLLLTDARRPARVSESGMPVMLDEQDRNRWDRASITTGLELLESALMRRTPGRFTVMAAIAAVHDQAESWDETDWQQIVGLYDVLVELWPSPVVSLNRAIAVGFAVGPEAGLVELDGLATEPRLAGYGYLAAARAGFLTRLDRIAEARTAYDEALHLTANDVERAQLEARLAKLRQE